MTQARPLKGVAEIRHFFRTNTTPIFFVGATPFNLLGLDRWVRGFDYITYYDAWAAVAGAVRRYLVGVPAVVPAA